MSPAPRRPVSSRWLSPTLTITDEAELLAYFAPKRPETLEVHIRLGQQDASLNVRAITVQKHRGVPDQSVSASDLRTVPVDAMLRMVRASARTSDKADVWADDVNALAEIRVRLEALAKPQRPGARIPDEVFVRVAVHYLEAAAAGRPSILREIAEQESRIQGRPVGVAGARDLVRGARLRGYLAPGSPGRISAEPGPNLAAAGAVAERGLAAAVDEHLLGRRSEEEEVPDVFKNAYELSRKPRVKASNDEEGSR